MHKTKMMLFNNVTPVLVFDGCSHPMKAKENLERNRFVAVLSDSVCQGAVRKTTRRRKA